MKIIAAFLIALPVGFMANAQNAPTQPKFEVASVKRAAQCEFKTSIDPGSVTLKGVPLKPVLQEAFQVPTERIEGPSWLDADCFEISAKMPEGATRDQLPAMLQALLADRFKLTAHKEDRLRPGYALVVDKGGLKCKEDDPNAHFMGNGRAGVVMFGFGGSGRFKGAVTMASLASTLSRRGYGPVQDLTGLTAKYDIDLSWAPDPAFEPMGAPGAAAARPTADAPPAPTVDLFTALRESLGLKLERHDAKVEFLVVDRVDRIPTEN